MPTLLTTAIALHGGVTGIAGASATADVSVINTWATGDTASIVLTSETANVTETLGAGESSGKQPVFALTFDKKLYALYGSVAGFSVVDEPIKFNDLNTTSNGTLNVSNTVGTTENLTAAAIYQNKLVLFAPSLIQIWIVNAEATQYSQDQTFEQIGTNAPLSVKSLGTLDVMFLANTGVRSLRVRESTLDADTVDIGTPIDNLIQEAIASGADEQAACAVVEPISKRYWVFLDDTIYVLSLFRGSKITAWSTYVPSYEYNFITGSQLFDILGQYNFGGLIDGNEYTWIKGNGTTLVSGANVLSDSGTIVADGTTATLSGSFGGTTVTGSLVGQRRFVPTMFDTFGNIVYARSSDNIVYAYGGAAGNTYDHVQARIESPWLDDNSPMQLKGSLSVDAGFSGEWIMKLGANPATGEVFQVLDHGDVVSPDANVDSTFDLLRFGIELVGSHFKISASSSSSSSEPAKLSEFHLLYLEREYA